MQFNNCTVVVNSIVIVTLFLFVNCVPRGCKFSCLEAKYHGGLGISQDRNLIYDLKFCHIICYFFLFFKNKYLSYSQQISSGSTNMHTTICAKWFINGKLIKKCWRSTTNKKFNMLTDSVFIWWIVRFNYSILFYV